jgi:hypothetical protein
MRRAAVRRRAARWLVAAGFVLAAGCEAGRAPPDGTARMADTLRSVHARALAEPQRFPFLNRARADSLQVMVAGLSGPDALQFRFMLAQERLLAGQTREAIAELDDLVRAVGASQGQITARNRELFDYLGIAWLRLGEQENCLDTPAANVCILPFTGDALHAKQEGARRAAALYEDLLRQFPDDLGARWLLNIARMALGGYPDSIPRSDLIPGLAPPDRRTFPHFPNIAGRLGLAVDGLAGGLSVADFTGNGLLDLFMTAWGPADPVRIFLADGRGGYYDHTSEARLEGITGGLNTVHADYDNDGHVDVLILRGAWLGDDGLWPNSLLRNRGDGTFEDVTFAAGLASFHPTHSAAWADFNLDGHLDLFIGNESMVRLGGGSHRSELYLNQGDGTFREVSREVGIDVDELVKGAVWGDINNNGLPDLYVSVLGAPNRLYVNLGPDSLGNWRFEERAGAAGVELPIYSFPVWFWDYDQDGWEDLLVLSYDLRHGTRVHEAVARENLGLPVEILYDGRRIEVEHSRLFRNMGDGTFRDVTRDAGLDKVVYAMGSNFGDLDNDGWLDFYIGTGNPDLRSIVPNRMFRNVEGRRFEEVTLPGGFGHIQKGHGIAFVDLDRDGDQDIYMVMGGAYEGDRAMNVLFENPGWPGRTWIALDLVGREANRSAIGARVEVVVEDGGRTRTLHRTVGTGGSFGAGALQVHVGLGGATQVRELRIRWPDAARTVTAHAGLAVNRFYRVVQGGEPEVLDRPPVPFRGRAAAAHPHAGHNP